MKHLPCTFIWPISFLLAYSSLSSWSPSIISVSNKSKLALWFSWQCCTTTHPSHMTPVTINSSSLVSIPLMIDTETLVCLPLWKWIIKVYVKGFQPWPTMKENIMPHFFQVKNRTSETTLFLQFQVTHVIAHHKTLHFLFAFPEPVIRTCCSKCWRIDPCLTDGTRRTCYQSKLFMYIDQGYYVFFKKSKLKVNISKY